MTVNKRDAMNRMVIIAYSMLSWLLMRSVPAPNFHIGLFWGLVCIAIAMSGLDLFHPYFWFSTLFGLYSTANAILYGSSSSYSHEQITMPLFALTIVLVIIGTERVDHSIYKESRDTLKQDSLSYIIWILIILTVVFGIILFSRGYYSKVQMRREGDIFFQLGVHIARYLTFFSILYLADILVKHNKLSWKLLIAGGTASLLFSLVTSERDVIFRFGFTILLLLFAYDIVNRKKLLLIIPIVIIGMTLSVYVKHFFLRGTLNDTFIRGGNIFTQFLSSDFSAAGDNLQYLLNNDGTKGQFGIGMFFTELFDPILFGVSSTNPDYWFNTVIHHSSFGHAFTLVGTGYIIAGYFGIFLVFLSVALIVKWLYRKSSQSLLWLTSYIYISSVVVFSFRQSLRTITGAMVKHVLIAVVVCLIIDKIKVKRMGGV